MSTGWVALLGVAVFFVFIVWVLPNQAAQAEENSGDAGSPDGSFYYTAADLYEMAEAYGEAGRQEYIRSRFTFDVIWPLAYMLFLGTTISWVFGKVFASGSIWQRVNLAPLLGGGFDYLENISASIVMARFPETTPLIDSLTPLFTMTKWVFVNGSFVILLAGLLLGGFHWARNRRMPAGSY